MRKRAYVFDVGFFARSTSITFWMEPAEVEGTFPESDGIAFAAAENELAAGKEKDARELLVPKNVVGAGKEEA
jgi:hypothetical protein